MLPETRSCTAFAVDRNNVGTVEAARHLDRVCTRPVGQVKIDVADHHQSTSGLLISSPAASPSKHGLVLCYLRARMAFAPNDGTPNGAALALLRTSRRPRRALRRCVARPPLKPTPIPPQNHSSQLS